MAVTSGCVGVPMMSRCLPASSACRAITWIFLTKGHVASTSFAPRAAVKVGEELSFAVRRDKIALSLGETAGPNGIAGKVSNVEYQGTFVKVEMMTAQNEEFVAYLDVDRYYAAPNEVGQRVRASWEARFNHVLPGQNNSTGTPHED